VITVNLQSVLQTLVDAGQQAYLRTDTHWNEAGAEAAASAIAQRIKALNLELTPEQAFNETRKEPVPRADSVAESVFTPHPAANASAGAEDLFGDTGLPNTALIGSSYSRNSNFLPFLEARLSTKIGNFALDGGGFSTSAQAYFTSTAFKDTPPRLIVWEIPERVLEETWDGAVMTVGF